MCDFIPGRLIVLYDQKDIVAGELLHDIRHNSVRPFIFVSNMRERFRQLNLPIPEGFLSELELLSVAEGTELFAAQRLRSLYLEGLLKLQARGTVPPRMASIIRDPELQMLVAPDSLLSLSQAGPDVRFQFYNIHSTYKHILGLPDRHGSTGDGVVVAILDTGLDSHTGIKPSKSSRNFHDDANSKDVADNNGHGTAVASIIHDLAPDAEIVVLKVGDGNPISEWNVLAAILVMGQASIVNMSLAFGLGRRTCFDCGRDQSHSSRSTIFEHVLKNVMQQRPEMIVIAAAGNLNTNQLDFPARYSEVVAVGAVQSTLSRASYSNYGAFDQDGDPHAYFFLAPGGEKGEFVAATNEQTGQLTEHKGTSFAAPYLAGLMALYQGRVGVKTDRHSTLLHFTSGAKTTFPGYNVADFGNGLAQV